MSISFKPLWKTLIDRGIKRYELIELANVSSNVVAKMGKDEPISLQSIEKICLALGCSVEEVIEIYEECELRND